MVDVPVVERHTSRLLAASYTRGSQAWRSYPTPERYKESKPSEEEHTTVHINGIEPGNRASLVVDRVDQGGPP